MTMKIHVLYQGIVYRVRGIKVLCSVVLAVIILLVAIVCMGAWMLVTAYNADPILAALNTSSYEAYQKVYRQTSEAGLNRNNYTSNEQESKKENLPVNKNYKYFVSSDEIVSLNYNEMNHKEKNINYDEDLLTPLVFPVPAAAHRGEHFVYDEIFSNQKKKYEQEPTEYSPTFLSYERIPTFLINKSYLEIAKEKIKDSNNKYVIKNDKEHKSLNRTYVGPPVVGYGKYPYAKLPLERIEGFDKVWDTFKRKKIEVNNNDTSFIRRIGHSRRRVNPAGSLIRPHQIRKMSYDISTGEPLKTQAKSSPMIPIRRLLKRTKLRSKLTRPRIKPYRKLLVKNNEKIHHQNNYIKSLKKVYMYSRKLSSLLLEFTINNQIKNNNVTDLLTKYGVDLIQDFNDIYYNKNDTFQLLNSVSTKNVPLSHSINFLLMAWTFVDYWEFLIQKIISLSNITNLGIVDRKLKTLRENKDIPMTWFVINKTIGHISNRTSKINEKRKKINLPVMPRTLTESSSRDIFLAEAAVNVLKKITNKYFPDKFSTNGLRSRSFNSTDNNNSTRDPKGIKRNKINFIQFTTKVMYNYGKHFLTKEFSVDCTFKVFCESLNKDALLPGMDGIPAKLKSVGLKVLSEKELRHSDTFGEIFRAVTSWQPLQCDSMFPKCDGERALEIVNEVAHGST